MNVSVLLRPALVLWCSVSLHCVASAAQEEKEPQAPPVRFQINVDKVLIPVVVRDKAGHAVGDLKREDFQIFDNGKPRPISAFTVEKHETAGIRSLVVSGSVAQSPTTLSAKGQSLAVPQRFIVFLFDDLHLDAAALLAAQKAAANALGGALANSEVGAVVATSGKTNSGLTRDRAKLKEAIVSLQPRGHYQSDSAECPKVDYYQADLIENKHDSPALQDAIAQITSVCNPRTPVDVAERLAHSTARRVLLLGQQDVQATFAAIGEYARRVAALPGQRTMILVSPGFLTITPEAQTLESRIIDLAAQSNLTISALDARGLYTASINASEDVRGRNVALVSDYRRSAMTQTEKPLSEFADGTGGSFYHNNNDLDAGFKSLAEAPESVYLIELSLDTVKPDGSYHRLKVTLDRVGLQLQARRGYFSPRQEKSKK